MVNKQDFQNAFDVDKSSKSLMRVGLGDIKRLKKEDLIKIILNREVAMDSMRASFQELSKKNVKEKFFLDRLKLLFSKEQIYLVNEIDRLEEEVKRLKNDKLILQGKISVLRSSKKEVLK